MSLINCSECDAEISDKAAACPKCGNPMRFDTAQAVKPKADRGYNLILVGGIIVIALTFFIVVGFVGYVAGSPKQLEQRKQQCIDTMTSSVGKPNSYQYSQEYRDKLKVACEGMEINGVKVVP